MAQNPEEARFYYRLAADAGLSIAAFSMASSFFRATVAELICAAREAGSHAVFPFSRLIVRHINAILGCPFEISVGQTIPSKPDKYHQVDILNIAALLETRQQSAKCRSPNFILYICSVMTHSSFEGGLDGKACNAILKYG